MPAIASAPGALRFFAVSHVPRLPVPMLSIGLLVHARHLTGSFAAAGLVARAFAIALGAGGPLLGALVHRRGHTAPPPAAATPPPAWAAPSPPSPRWAPPGRAPPAPRCRSSWRSLPPSAPRRRRSA